MIMDKSNYLVITPTFNEIENIDLFIKKILDLHLDILIVDDNSPDGTGKFVNKKKEQFKNLHLLSRESKQGLGSAYRMGFDWAIDKEYEYVIQMDADFSHRIDDLIKLIEFDEDFDILIGSRYVPGGNTTGWSSRRKLLSFLANKLSKFLVGGNINDLTSGFRIYSQESLNAIPYNDITSDGYSFQIEMTSLFINTSLNYIETPITFEERRQGQSKMNFGIILEAALKIFSIFLKRIFK
tara:strand:- start:2608 stop:3324 length:717 start_codon:yes stop_codon:yes gene_type:complete